MSKYPKNYASAQEGTGQGSGNATNATTKGASGGAFAVKRRNKF
jgi:hypothetical protein